MSGLTAQQSSMYFTR